MLLACNPAYILICQLDSLSNQTAPQLLPIADRQHFGNTSTFCSLTVATFPPYWGINGCMPEQAEKIVQTVTHLLSTINAVHLLRWVMHSCSASLACWFIYFCSRQIEQETTSTFLRRCHNKQTLYIETRQSH